MSEKQHDERGDEGEPDEGHPAPSTKGSPFGSGPGPAPSAKPSKKKKKAAETEAPDARSRPEPAAAAADDDDDDASAQTDEPAPEEEAPLLPVGNPVRLWRGSATIVVGALLTFCLMAVTAQLRFGVPLGALGVLIATFGVLDLAGTFDDPDDRVAGRATLAQLARPLGLFLGGGIGFWAVVSLAVDGRLSASHPVIAAGVLVPASFLTTVVGAYQVAGALGVWTAPDGEVRPLHRRHGFWLIVLTTLLYLPSLGSHSLSDPWETHYGEVAREILARNDWISTWWAQDGWFWSKPVLDFWIQALAMATFGVRTGSDRVLSAVSEGRVPWPEWAVRLPVFMLTAIAVYLLYKAVAKAFGRRAGLLGGVVLLTMPQWFLLGHQTMTDMPFVAPMASAMALFLLGTYEGTDDEVRVYEISLGPLSLRVSAFHLVIGAIVACSIPQILYLLSRNVGIDERGFHTQLDTFMSGSPGNCGVPGNEACRQALPVIRGLHPALQALIWAQALALVVYLNWGERRRQRLYFLGAWLFAALSTMAKGPAGVALPLLCVVTFVALSRTQRDRLPFETPLDVVFWRLRAMTRIEWPSGLLIVLAVALPWFVAMYVRHGQPFTDRLLFHDMFKRAFTHVHDTNEGDDVSFRFYVWQLGYATFPWTGLVPAGLLFWLRQREDKDRSLDASVFLVIWFIFAFALFSVMLTKFHHYILPAVPPAAMLTGVLLDGLLRRSLPAADGPPRERSWVDIGLYGAGLTAGMVALIWGGSRIFAVVNGAAGATRGWLYSGGGVLAVGVAAIAATVVVLGRVVTMGDPERVPQTPPGAGGWARASASAPGGHDAEGDPAREPSDRATDAFRRRFEVAQLGAVGIAAAMVVVAVGRDLSANLEGLPNQIRLMHLVTYNYRRPWPASLDFTPTLAAFTAAAALLCLALLVARLRRHVVAGLVALGVVFGAWGLDVYFMEISPHWGQRETTVAYYQAAREIPGPLIAYQMNWKGENFYTGNHVPAFVSSGKKFQDHVIDEKKKGVRTFYFMTEHGRTSTLSNELGATKEFEKLTTPELNNKFVLVRARFE